MMSAIYFKILKQRQCDILCDKFMYSMCRQLPYQDLSLKSQTPEMVTMAICFSCHFFLLTLEAILISKVSVRNKFSLEKTGILTYTMVIKIGSYW